MEVIKVGKETKRLATCSECGSKIFDYRVITNEKKTVCMRCLCDALEELYKPLTWRERLSGRKRGTNG
jgi:formylmethanofuran dehydrogenase subunit E